jgi:hypothetical protein
MHVAMQVMDAVTIVSSLGLLAILSRKWMLYLGIGLELLLIAALYAHRNFDVSWTVLGKIGVNAVIPLVMALVGNYLAAEIKESVVEKRLWRALFIALAVIGTIGSFIVETQLDAEHKKEIGSLREGIKEDLAKGFIDYNAAHPGHPLTSEQYIELTKRLDSSRQRKSASSDLSNLPSISNVYLATMAQSLGYSISNREMEWVVQDDHIHETYRIQFQLAKTQQEKNLLTEEYTQKKAALKSKYEQDMAELIQDGNFARKLILQRLGLYPPINSKDKTVDDQFESFLRGDIKLANFDARDNGVYLTHLGEHIKQLS